MNFNNTISKGKGIFVFSDPAGANSVLAIVDELILLGHIPKKDFLVFTNSMKAGLDEYKNVLDVLCDYLYKTKMYISKTDLYKFSSIYGIRSIDIRSFVKDIKKFLPEMKELIDFQDSDVYRFDNLEINSGVSKVKQ